MEVLDITTYIIQSGALVSILIALGIAAFTFVPQSDFIPFETDDGRWAWVRFRLYLLSISALVSMILLIPTHQRILHVKISKIKNEAVTQENLNAGVEEIKRIGKKLEEKYLGD